MQPYYPPEYVRQEHELMIRRELQRNYPQIHRYFSESDFAYGSLMAIRRSLGRWLINLGTRIEPGTRGTGGHTPTADPAMTRRLGRA